MVLEPRILDNRCSTYVNAMFSSCTHINALGREALKINSYINHSEESKLILIQIVINLCGKIHDINDK